MLEFENIIYCSFALQCLGFVSVESGGRYDLLK